MMNNKWKELVVFLKDWRDYMNGLIPASYAELDWSGNENDTPIYDQLLVEWHNKNGYSPFIQGPRYEVSE
jgi:hypothetical protein